MLREQGKMTGTEKLTSVLMILTLAGWITKSFTGIPECVFAIVTYAVLFTVGAITKQEFRSKVPWDVWIYVGGIVCVANLFTTLGIDSWLAGVMEPLVRILTCNEFVYIAALVIIVYVSRIFIVSSIAAVTIFYVVFASTAYQLLGINPFIISKKKYFNEYIKNKLCFEEFINSANKYNEKLISVMESVRQALTNYQF